MQLIVVIREPVARAYSGYSYFVVNLYKILESLGLEGLPRPEPFLDVVKRKMAQLESIGLNPGSGTLLICLFCSYACKFYSNEHHKS